ncbi:MAE_28990/MAE_18760 family HEPN-like nuclease [Photobacterium kishitanii]|uniref:MAE_28990/MAE_18760 family HEPN-like nuclease n=1 Tax=Photobacterium kishitanii TaxID=318456 RepID=UPI003F74B72D
MQKITLNLDILYSILKIVGIEHKECMKLKDVYINQKLLENRNKIAHGNKIDSFSDDFNIKIEDAIEIRDIVFKIMTSIKEDLIYHAENELYLFRNKTSCDTYNKKSNIILRKGIIYIMLYKGLSNETFIQYKYFL